MAMASSAAVPWTMEALAAHVRSKRARQSISYSVKAPGIEKQLARQRIYELFSPDAWPEPLLMVTMPSVEWSFEKQLIYARRSIESDDGRRPTFFISFENNRALYFAGCTQMPGVAGVKRPHLKTNRKFDFCEMGVQSKLSTFFFANIEDYMEYQTLCPHDCYPVDAAWLDFTGPMTTKRLALIGEYYRLCVRGVLIVTMLKARENDKEFVNDRKSHLVREMPGDVLHCLEYFDTSPMLQFAVKRTNLAGFADYKYHARRLFEAA